MPPGPEDDLERGQPHCRLDHARGRVDPANAGCLRDEQVALRVVGDVVRAVHLRLRGGAAVAARGLRPVAGDQLEPPRRPDRAGGRSRRSMRWPESLRQDGRRDRLHRGRARPW